MGRQGHLRPDDGRTGLRGGCSHPLRSMPAGLPLSHRRRRNRLVPAVKQERVLTLTCWRAQALSMRPCSGTPWPKPQDGPPAGHVRPIMPRPGPQIHRPRIKSGQAVHRRPAPQRAGRTAGSSAGRPIACAIPLEPMARHAPISAKLQALIRKAAVRTCERFRQAVGQVCGLFTQEECCPFFKAPSQESEAAQRAKRHSKADRPPLSPSRR